MNNNAGIPKRSRGGQPGNQNARKHGRHYRLQPADRSAFLRKVLRSYGIEDTIDFEGTPLVVFAAQSNIHLIFILVLLEEAAHLTGLQAQLAQAECRLNQS